MSGDPYPKAQQLHRGARRYRRKIAGPKQWQAIHAEKCDGLCRICGAPGLHDAHHLIPRDRFGDDIPDNIIGLCRECHGGIEHRNRAHVNELLSSLTDAEYSYAIEKGGEDVFERVYGIRYQRV